MHHSALILLLFINKLTPAIAELYLTTTLLSICHLKHLENTFSHYYGILTPLNQWWKNL
jgi:hypothetical protein